MNPRRVLLKLSGEALAGPNKTGFDEASSAAGFNIRGCWCRGRHRHRRRQLLEGKDEQCNRPHQGRSDRNAGHGYELYLCF